MTESSRDIELTGLAIDLRPQSGEIPLAASVFGLEVQINNAALEKVIVALLTMAREKLPVDVEFEGAMFTSTGAEAKLAAGLNRFLKARATADIAISAENSESVAVRIAEIRTLGKVPIEGIVGPIIGKALDKAAERPGITKDPSHHRGLLIEPNAMLAELGVPLQFAGNGNWTVINTPGQLTVRYTPS